MRMTVGVMGPSGALDNTQRLDAYEIGAAVAKRGLVLITGGMSGVMESASAGAKQAGGLVVGLCPGRDKADVNSYVDVAIMTSMGGGRNYMNILSSDIVVAIGSNTSAGTLSEIAFALQQAVPIMIMRPPMDMRHFLSTFDSPIGARFGDSVQEADAFIGECVAQIEASKSALAKRRKIR